MQRTCHQEEPMEEKETKVKTDNPEPGDSDKVLCFVTKRLVDRKDACQVSHPREGKVWVTSALLH
jgi:hypothetical protein